MRSLKIKCALLLTTTLLCATALVAQPPQRPCGARPEKGKNEMSAEEMAKMRCEKLSESLKLKDSQKKKLYDINLKYAKEAEAQRQKAKEAAKNIQESRRAMEESMKSQQKEVMAILSDDQKIEFIDMLTKAKRSGKGQHSKGGRPQHGAPKRGCAPACND